MGLVICKGWLWVWRFYGFLIVDFILWFELLLGKSGFVAVMFSLSVLLGDGSYVSRLTGLVLGRELLMLLLCFLLVYFVWIVVCVVVIAVFGCVGYTVWSLLCGVVSACGRCRSFKFRFICVSSMVSGFVQAIYENACAVAADLVLLEWLMDLPFRCMIGVLWIGAYDRWWFRFSTWDGFTAGLLVDAVRIACGNIRCVDGSLQRWCYIGARYFVVLCVSIIMARCELELVLNSVGILMDLCRLEFVNLFSICMVLPPLVTSGI
eukprot:gene3172-2154_t